MQWSSFSPSIAIHVLLPQFQTSEVALLSQVNRHWRALFKQESVWQALLMRDFPPSSESELPETVENATPEKRVNANDFRWTLVGARDQIPLRCVANTIPRSLCDAATFLGDSYPPYCPFPSTATSAASSPANEPECYSLRYTPFSLLACRDASTTGAQAASGNTSTRA